MSTNVLTAYSSFLANDTASWKSAKLCFVQPNGYLKALEEFFDEGTRTFLMRPHNASLAVQLKLHFGPAIRILSKTPDPTPLDVVIVPPLSGPQLAHTLLDYVDRPKRLVVPVTAEYITNRSLFAVTIPKAGTHLLFHLLDSFGVQPGGEYYERLMPNTYYFLFRDHSHLPADEFVEMLAHTSRGGAGHPFLSAPVLFIYRNPLDILVSEVFYYVNRKSTALARFYEDLSPEERAAQLIEGYPLLPSLRVRVGRYAPWLRLKNVVPLCYEELVGERGGGSDEAMARAVWSLQLKLQVPGSPLDHARRAYTDRSHTFRKGHINDHRDFFTAEHYAAFRRLPQDFMHAFGYDLEDHFVDGYLPRFVDDFRQRPLHLGSATH